MAYANYTAKRDIIAGHTLSALYAIEFRSMASSPSRHNEKQSSTSLSGATQTIAYRQEKRVDITTGAFLRNSTAYLAFQEFINSVAFGEPFEIDPNGTIASHASSYTAMLEGDASESRVDMTDYFTFSFTIKAL